jgi:acetyl esterase
VAIGGDSAGANFATIISQIQVEEKATAPALQFLIYPSCDRSTGYPSEDLFGEGLFLTKRDLAYFFEHYMGGISEKDWEEKSKHPWISPLFGKSLGSLPPTIIVTAGFDMLRDEGEAYARALNKAGTEAVLLCQEGMVHGFINMIGFSPAARQSFDSVLSTLKEKLT